MLSLKLNIDMMNWSQDMWPRNAKSKNINALALKVKKMK